MKQTICFHALQTLPIVQQRKMVKRLQQENKQCDEVAIDKKVNMTIANKSSGLEGQIVSLDQK